MRLGAIALVLGAAVFTSICSAQTDTPSVIAQRATQPPTLDGRLDEMVWQQAEWYSGFTRLGEVDEPAEAQTQFAVAFDRENLYFGVKCAEPNMDQLKATVTERDGKVHRDDVVELMVDSTGDRVEYYHFSVNALGTLYDAQMRQGGNVRSVEWDCDWRAAVHHGEDFWSVEAAIPFLELELNEASRGPWALNVTRERHAGVTELSSFTQATAGFHQPGFYAQLQLPGADLERFMWQIRDPFDVMVVSEDGQVTYRAKTHVTNQTGRFWLALLIPELLAGESVARGESVPVGLDDGQGREVSFSIPVAEQGAQILRLRIVDRRDPDRVLHVRKIPVRVNYTPLAIEITRPCYRNSIYATQEIDEIELHVRCALTDEQLQGRRLSAAILDPEAGSVIATGQSAPAATEVTLTVPAEDLAVGDYEVGVQLVAESGEVEHSARAQLRRLPPSPSGHEWRIDENNVLLHNGEPFLPFGWFSYRVSDHEPDSPYTAMQDYNAQWRSVGENEELMDEIFANGLFVTIYPYSREFMNQGEVLQQPLREDEREALVERVTALMDHPALMAWYMADEPELKPVLPRRAEQIYEACRQADPYHPCIMLNDTIAGIYTYAGGGDILMPDPYPLFMEGGLAGRGIERTSEFMKAVRDATGGKKPAWITPQAFNYGDAGRAGNRAPNFTELRNQMYQAIVYGAKGFLWYTHSHARNYPDLHLGMEFLGREIADLKEAVLAPEVPDAVSVDAPQPEHIHTSVRRLGDELVLFTVNTATEPQEATFRLEGAPDRLYVVSEDRSVELADGVFSDSFATYAAHVYTTDEALADRRTLADVQAEIAAADRARKKPGNLAFEDSGVEIEVSSGARYNNTPARVVDGIEQYMGWRADPTHEGPQWLQLTWPQDVTVGRVVVYTPSIRSLAIEVPEGDGWTAVAEAAGEDRLEATFDPVTTRSIRVLIQELAEEAREATIQEVEAYAR